MRAGVFEHNQIIRCRAGFNFDTGGNRNVIIRNNEFIDCLGGGHIINGDRFTIESNTFLLPYNVKGVSARSNHGLRIRDFTRNFTVRNNAFSVPEGSVFDPDAPTTAIYVFGGSIGVRWTEDPPGTWKRVPARHIIEGNTTSPLLKNRITTKAPGDWIYARVDGRDVNLSGRDAVGDGTEFTW
jgi:hypothetical protein